jgi:hypothetical protein
VSPSRAPDAALDLREARRYLPRAGGSELAAFTRRQGAARRRFTDLRGFYRRHPCRMARVHLLTASAVTLGRFCGLSTSFEAIGEALQPVDAGGRPRSPAWARFASACEEGLAWEVRDERWIEAHMLDMEDVRTRGLAEDFAREALDHPGDPTWRLLRQHMDATLGARLVDGDALVGTIPVETAIAHGIATALRRLLGAGGRLLARYAFETARAILSRSVRGPAELASYRSVAGCLVWSSLSSWSAWKVYRRGARGWTRGHMAPGDTWPLLASVLGDRVGEVDPLVVRFYSNPSRFDATASLELNTWPARVFSLLATVLVGQGLYERSARELAARLRVFRRADGSMHFVREIYPRGVLRVFDSDFLVRDVDGQPTLFEVFVDDRVDVQMVVAPLEGGGLSILGRRILYRGVRLPEVGLEVEFQSTVERCETRGATLRIDGRLRMRPKTRLGRWLVRGFLRRPEELGRIRYVVRETAAAVNE